MFRSSITEILPMVPFFVCVPVQNNLHPGQAVAPELSLV